MLKSPVCKILLRQLGILSLALLIIISCIISICFICPLFLLLRTGVVCLAKWFRKDLHRLIPGPKVLFAYDSITERPKLNLAGYFILDEKPDLENIRSLAQRRIIEKCREIRNGRGNSKEMDSESSVTSTRCRRDSNSNNIEESDFEIPLVGGGGGGGGGSGGRGRAGSGELLYPELQQTWTTFGGYFFWKWDKDFQISNHIRMYDYSQDLPLPSGDEGSECNEDHLQKVFGGLLERPWVKGRSPWEILFIGNFKSIHSEIKTEESDSVSNNIGKSKNDQKLDGAGTGRQYVVAFRVHHAIGDGYSFLKVLQDAAGVDMTNRKINFPKYSTCERILCGAVFPFKFPYDVAANLVDSFDGFNSWHLVDTKLCRRYNSCISKPFPMELIKRIKNKHGVSYNAVLCAAAGGAYCKLMKDAGQQIPRKVSCMFPFPLPNHPGGLVLHAASIFIRWPMAKASCSVERLHRINDEMKKSKFYTGHLFYSAVSLFLGVSPTIFTRISRNKIKSTVGVSCLPAPDEPLDFLGAKMRDVIVGAGAAPGKLAGTMVLLSICGKQRFVANIDKTVFPSEEMFRRLGDYVEEELKGMLMAGDSISNEDTFINAISDNIV